MGFQTPFVCDSPTTRGCVAWNCVQATRVLEARLLKAIAEERVPRLEREEELSVTLEKYDESLKPPTLPAIVHTYL